MSKITETVKAMSESLNDKSSRRPFGVRLLDSIVPSILSAAASAVVVGYVSLQVMQERVLMLTTRLDAMAHDVDLLKVSVPVTQSQMTAVVQRIDAALTIQNDMNRKMDDRMTFLERYGAPRQGLRP